MRVTNRMMTLNMMSNINQNKINMSKRADQYATEQKIQRPSEDPVVAVRSLKYRTQLTELTQYVDKNIPDAFSWMDITESAMKSINEIITNINTYCDQGANDTLEVNDRNTIVETLEQYKQHILDMGNTDFAGRYVFTGYRTDTPLLFEEPQDNITYTIKENLTYENIKSTSYVSGGATYDAAKDAADYAAEAPTLETAQKLMLSYNNLDVIAGGSSLNSLTITQSDGTELVIPSDEADALGYSLITVSASDPDCYAATTDDSTTPPTKQIKYIPERGEIIFCDDIYTEIQTCKGIQAEYVKTNFEAGEIVPQHYFECTAVNNDLAETDKKHTINYSAPEVQKIEYEINFAQKLTVNTMGCDAISTEILTKIDEIIRSVNDVFDMGDQIAAVEKQISDSTSKEEIANLTKLKEQLETEEVLKRRIMQETFSSGLTMSKNAQEKMNIAIANHGSRYLRLQLTEARLETQEIDFTDMLKTNDYVELEEAIINYESAELIYNASLSCASTIVKNTLLDYIR